MEAADERVVRRIMYRWTRAKEPANAAGSLSIYRGIKFWFDDDTCTCDSFWFVYHGIDWCKLIYYWTYCYVGNSTEVDFSNYKYVGFNIPRPKRVVFWGINSTQSRIHSRKSTGVFTRQTTVHSPKNRLPLRKHTCTSTYTNKTGVLDCNRKQCPQCFPRYYNIKTNFEYNNQYMINPFKDSLSWRDPISALTRTSNRLTPNRCKLTCILMALEKSRAKIDSCMMRKTDI